MIEILTPEQTRVLGALIEKAITTPDYYPMTLNGLVTACNQKTNRNPVVCYDSKTVVRALELLREQSLAVRITSADARVPKYRHNILTVLSFSPPQLAVICVLLLRGAQTVGELRQRSKRLYNFGELVEVETTLEDLEQWGTGALVQALPRLPGTKECRYVHLLAGEPDIDQYSEDMGRGHFEAATLEVQAENERIGALEDEVQSLREEMAGLKAEFDSFRQQFE